MLMTIMTREMSGRSRTEKVFGDCVFGRIVLHS